MKARLKANWSATQSTTAAMSHTTASRCVTLAWRRGARYKTCPVPCLGFTVRSYQPAIHVRLAVAPSRC